MVIYIGNNISSHGYTTPSMETLVPKLKEMINIKDASSKKNILLRFLHMNYIFFNNFHRLGLLIVDVFSSKAFYFAFFFGFVSRLLGIPFITIIRGGDIKNRIKKSPTLSNYLFSNAVTNISPSLFFSTFFSEKNYNVLYIPNFINLEDYPFQLRQSIKPKLLWVRSFHKVYNPQMAIRVLYKLSKKYNNPMLTMVGPDKDGSKRLCIDLAKKLNIEKQIKFTGKLTKNQWISLSSKSDIFINTTHIDNMPVSVIEAMALGLPIISTNVGGIPYLLKHGKTALLVNDGDTDGMVNEIMYLINDHHQSKKLSNNALLIAQKYSWDNISVKWKKLIRMYSINGQ